MTLAGFLSPKHGFLIHGDVSDVFGQYAVVLMIVDGLNSEKLFISPDDACPRALPEPILDPFRSLKPLVNCGLAKKLELL